MAENSTPESPRRDSASKILPGDTTVVPQETDGDEAIDHRDLEQRLRLKVDLRLCTIAGILCSLNLLDSGVISSASVTSMIDDLGKNPKNATLLAV